MPRASYIFVFFMYMLAGCQSKSPANKRASVQAKPGTDAVLKPYVALQHPEWSKNATIYEVNVRQYTSEGTFKAFERHLPRLKELGIDIIWLMPIHPIGVQNRKGTLGSEYSVKDYYGVNPEFGTMEDFRALVKKIHSMGMKVILDWVANHSAWDNALATDHPDWYTKTSEGAFQPTPWYDWGDVIDFDYNVAPMRTYMEDAMTFWVREADIDGYRCDVAGFIPVAFWEGVRKRLDAMKPVFMLAEWESRDLHRKAFDATYAWSLWDKLKDATTENKGIGGLIEYMAHDVNTFPREAYRMTFTENHDKNSWEGTQFSNFGNALPACMVMACVVNGMPLVYGGQEAGLNKSLLFFDKDSINWKPHPFAQLYTKLFALKHSNQAVWNGAWGGEMIRIFNDKPQAVISFWREKNKQKVLPIINFSNQPLTVTLTGKGHIGAYKDLFTDSAYTLKGDDKIRLNGWGYLVLVQ